LDDRHLDHLDADLGLTVHPAALVALLASCLGLDVEHPELPALKELLGEPFRLIHRMGYYPDAAQLLAVPFQLIHRMGYYPDADLLDVVHLDVVHLDVAHLASVSILQFRARLPVLRLLEQQELESELEPQPLALVELAQQEPQLLALVLELGWESLQPRE
jgi:hypothetical protein